MCVMGDKRQIRTTAYPKCILCGCEGQFLYSQLEDRLFGASGAWSFKVCPNRKCKLIWLDPMPVKEDLAKAYASYYTHSTRNNGSSASRLRLMFRSMERAFWIEEYDYRLGPRTFRTAIMAKLMYLLPLQRRRADGGVRFLRSVPQGYLLDVGCGSGEWLAFMRDLGWQVEGVDFDENAVRVAKQKGLNVHCGALELQNYPDAKFDAVTLNHVIEHVPDPIGILSECARILKPSGKIVVFTPNSSSLGHRVFKHNWRGLEPPRHLHLFSTQSLPFLLARAGFRNIKIRPQIARSVIYESALLWHAGKGFSTKMRRVWPTETFARLFNAGEFCLMKWNPGVADCVWAVAAGTT
jgi:2-polyprenyl-3-methyl-5-hydroxy-6-metoxy-1,4-benzoquinol methylase